MLSGRKLLQTSNHAAYAAPDSYRGYLGREYGVNDAVEGLSNFASEFGPILPQILDDQQSPAESLIPMPRTAWVRYLPATNNKLNYTNYAGAYKKAQGFCTCTSCTYRLPGQGSPRCRRSDAKSSTSAPLDAATELEKNPSVSCLHHFFSAFVDDMRTQDFSTGIFPNARHIVIMGGTFVSHSLKLHNFSIITCFT